MKKDKSQHDRDVKVRFGQVYARYCGRIYNFALRLSHGNSYVAEELTQTVFMKLWERFEQLEGAATLEAYLFQIARNTFINDLKRETLECVYRDYVMGHHDVASHDHTDGSIDADSIRMCVASLVEQMPPVRRRVFVMSRIEGLPNKHIAMEMGIAESTVETHIALALGFIRRELRLRFGIICTLATIVVQAMTM